MFQMLKNARSVFWDVTPLVWQTFSDVSEEFTASIFNIEE
jgi:hypothetical protein